MHRFPGKPQAKIVDRLYRRTAASIATALAFCGCTFAQPLQESPRSYGNLRFEYDNDLLVDSDDKFTSGVSVQWHSRPAKDWEAVPAPGWTTFGRRLPGLRTDGLNYRVGMAVGQNIQTPKDLSATGFIEDDVPYAGALGFELNWLAFDNERMRAYALILGVVGPWSGAEATQKWIHDLIDADEPMGWDNQLPNEVAVNFNGAFKKKLVTAGERAGWSADAAIGTDFGLGTALTFAEVSLEVRAGFNVPEGFAFVPDPVGRSIAYDATLQPRGSRETSVYLSFIRRQTYMQHFIFVDGSLFQDTPSVDVDRWQHQNIVSLHITRGRWGLHLAVWDGSGNLESISLDEGNDFGTIAFEWRF